MSCTVPPLRNIHGTLKSLEEVLLYNHDPKLHNTPPGGVCSRSYTNDNLCSRTAYNRPPCTPKHCMTLYVIWMWEGGRLEICRLYTMKTKFCWRTPHSLWLETYWKMVLPQRKASGRACLPARSIYRRCWNGESLQEGYVAYNFPPFPALDITVATRQLLEKERWHDTNELTLGPALCTHSDWMTSSTQWSLG